MAGNGLPGASDDVGRPRFPRLAFVILSIVFVFLSVTAVIVYFGLNTYHPEYCGPWVDGSPMYFTRVEKGGLSDNLTASWKAKCVTERFGHISDLRVMMYMDHIKLGAQPQDLEFGKVMRFGPEVSAIISDTGQNGILSSGDSFLVYGMSGSHSWDFYILWSDESPVSRVDWHTP